MTNTRATTRHRIWDLPTRLFHWALVALVIAAFAAAKVGGDWITWHFYAGYATLTLMLFRIVWGFVGGRYARFASFLYGPKAIIAYVRCAAEAPRTAGHNPLGSLSVFALIIAVFAQAALGLFANDEIASEGPLAHLVSRDASDVLTSLHRLNQDVIVALVALHVAAIAFYTFFRREPLVGAMLHGDKPLPDEVEAPGPGRPRTSAPAPSRDDAALRVRAAIVLALCAATVWWVVN